MTLSMLSANRLRGDGFTERELGLISEATAPDGSLQPETDIDSPVWQRVRYDRQELVGKLKYEWEKAKGESLDRTTLDRIIDNFGPKDPWQWLKLIYIPKKKLDYIDVQKQAAEKATKRLRELKIRG